MLCIEPEETDPFYSLAAEEYLLKNYADDIFMVWQSFDAVVVGKHQNALAEIDYRYVRENGIRVARRISGGGTVFHDQGNVNFSFIKNVNSPQEISFKTFTAPILEVLTEMGVPAESSGRNDLLVRGKKISGNAEHVYKNRVLHHGTLLFNADLKRLGNAIRVIPGKYTGKAVASNRSEVTNIADYLSEPITLREFTDHLVCVLLGKSRENVRYKIPETDQKKIRQFVEQRFATWEWQFGYSPDYRFTNAVILNDKKLDINLFVRKGTVESARIEGNYYPPELIPKLEGMLQNKPHRYEAVEAVHKELDLPAGDEVIYSYF